MATYPTLQQHLISYLESDPHDASKTVEAVEAVGARCIAVACDVGKSEDVEKLAQTAIEEFGRLDIVAALAGILRKASLHEMTDSRFEEMMNIDLLGVLRVFRSCAARMTDGGSMVATSSIAGGHYGWDHHSHYAAAKAGLLGLCRSLAVELAPREIRVNTIIPGLIESPQSLDAENSLGKAGLKAAGSYIPLGRVGRLEECARAIRFLTSDDASFITGQQLIVDGGQTVRWPS
ncbi:SDR family NAD(P)-dependent oxidoreductase [Corynebacterium glutamicum]|uniref:SDR family NAD(P)-dependent oxidoreductase n=1 Tax=Corynebacterium glutamicum TaxID=1718 RepID=UPI0020162240|nr:SDR family oxidoreductase [Corynebacterium glutamicum]